MVWLSSQFSQPLVTQLCTALQLKVRTNTDGDFVVLFSLLIEYTVSIVTLIEWPPVVVDASKSGSEFQKQLDAAALKVKTSYW